MIVSWGKRLRGWPRVDLISKMDCHTGKRGEIAPAVEFGEIHRVREDIAPDEQEGMNERAHSARIS